MIIGLIMISRASETKNLTKAVSNLTFAPKQEATVKNNIQYVSTQVTKQRETHKQNK